MTPRPIYRWKSFWLGGVVLVFLGWAWVRSMERSEDVTVMKGSRIWIWSSQSASLTCTVTTLPMKFPSKLGFDANVIVNDHHDYFPKAFSHRGEPGMEFYQIAYWFVMVFFLVPWLAFLFWRVRKQGRNTA
jgi:hypothetical protein